MYHVGESGLGAARDDVDFVVVMGENALRSARATLNAKARRKGSRMLLPNACLHNIAAECQLQFHSVINTNSKASSVKDALSWMILLCLRGCPRFL